MRTATTVNYGRTKAKEAPKRKPVNGKKTGHSAKAKLAVVPKQGKRVIRSADDLTPEERRFKQMVPMAIAVKILRRSFPEKVPDEAEVYRHPHCAWPQRYITAHGSLKKAWEEG